MHIIHLKIHKTAAKNEAKMSLRAGIVKLNIKSKICARRAGFPSRPKGRTNVQGPEHRSSHKEAFTATGLEAKLKPKSR